MPTDKKTIKSYDDFAANWAKKLRTGNNHAHTFLEKPVMYKKLGDLKGKNILCVGCGTGEECEHLLKLGAKKVVGIDISKGLIGIAKESYPSLEFHVMDMEKIDFLPNSFDLVYSSLTMHYVRNWKKTLCGIYKILKNNGTILLSTHHPVKWGAEVIRSKTKRSLVMGYEKHDTGEYRVFGDYLNVRKIESTWFDELKVSFYHRPLADIIKDILDCGFYISDFIEPKPTKGVLKESPIFYDTHIKIPLFMIFELRKK